MTNITFSLPDNTIRRLKRRASDSGRKKGVMSEIVDQALTSYLDTIEASATSQIFTAMKGEVVVAKAGSLKALAESLIAKKVDPRTVEIRSSRPLEAVGHLGFRVRRA